MVAPQSAPPLGTPQRAVMSHALRRLLVRTRALNWALADQALVSGANFLTGIALARLLGIEGFGRFALALMAVQLVAAVEYAAIAAPMMAVAPKRAPAAAPAYFAAVCAQQGLVALLAGAAVAVAAWGAAGLTPDLALDGLAGPLVAATVAVPCQDFVRRVLFVRGHGGAAALADGVRYLGPLAAFPALAAVGRLSPASALLALAVFAALATALGGAALGPLRWRRRAFAPAARRHWRSAKWLAPSAVVQWLSGNAFFVAAGALLGPAAVGGLKAAQTLMGVTHVVLQGLENVVPVAAARRLHRAGKAALGTFTLRVTLAVVAATAAIAGVAAAAPGFWLALVFGPAYDAYAESLRWFALVYVAIAAGFPLRAALRALETTRVIFLAHAAAAAFAVLAAPPLVAVAGPLGAVWGLLAATLAGDVILAAALARALTTRRSPAPALKRAPWTAA